MKTRTINIYTFEELNEKAQRKAIEDHRYIETEGFEWYKFTYEKWIEELKTQGYEDTKIQFSGFYSQGDGASFEATIDIAKWLTVKECKTKYKACFADAENIVIAITQSGHYSHEMTMSTDTEYNGVNRKAYDTVDQLAEEILQDAREQARLIYKDLESEYEHLTSDETVKECLIANEYEFIENGERA